MHAAMLAEHLASFVDDLAAQIRGVWAQSFNDFCVVAVGNEADFLAIRFVRGAQPKAASALANLMFTELADGKGGGTKLFLAQGEQEIALVLLPIDTTKESRCASLWIMGEPRIMSGRYAIGAKDFRALEQMIDTRLLSDRSELRIDRKPSTVKIAFF